MRKAALIAASILFVAAGCMHFIAPSGFVRIVPPQIPWPLAMVYLTGAAEILGGAGLLVPQARRSAAWGLVALLVAVFPANVYMAFAHIQVTENPLPAWILWARLPLQLVLIGWVLWCSKKKNIRV